MSFACQNEAVLMNLTSLVRKAMITQTLAHEGLVESFVPYEILIATSVIRDFEGKLKSTVRYAVR